MTGTEQVKAYLTAQLKQAGIQTVQAWERRRIPQLNAPAAVVGVEETRSSSAALWAYLGLTQEENAAVGKERYGRRLELSLCVDFYAPRAQAQKLEACCEVLETLCFSPLAAFLHISGVRRGEIRADRISGYLQCRCTAACTAYLTATRDEDSAELTDFILKGVLQ